MTTPKTAEGNNTPPVTENNTPPAQSKKEETVPVEKKMLQDILKRVEGTEEELKETKKLLEEKDEEIDMLKQVADVGRMAQWEDKHRGSILNTVKLGLYDGRAIIGWDKMQKNDVKVLANGNVVVNQTTRLLLLGDTDKDGKRGKPIEKVIDYADFSTSTTMEECEVIKKVREETEDGEVLMYKIRRKDGQELIISPTFLNAF